ncbi:hypothetical protein [Streptomyces sp. AC495_CC817]|uniref:hypothetical protein n=1 Tax=Streptomyces sp. AC495_CC817 TaxID=2823900 RepID=UPI001C2563FB|nr:hypothetical protein [Streptomyces sp. AC495_CC817]
MSRRTTVLLGAVVAALLLALAAFWVWQATGARPQSTPPPSPPATTPAPAAERAQAELDELLEVCARSAAPDPPEHCGIRIPWGTEFAAVNTVAYRIEKMPVIELDGSAFTAAGGVLVATVTGTGQDGSARTETYRTDDWAVRGDARVTDSAVDLDVW